MNQMKRLYQIFLLLIVASLFMGCEKEETLAVNKSALPLQEGFEGRTNRPASFFAKVNGNPFDALAVRGIIEDNAPFGMSVTIEAYTNEGKIILNTQNNSPGLYFARLNPLFNSIDYLPDSSFTDYSSFWAGNSSNARVNISGLSTLSRVSGTFQGNISDVTGQKVANIFAGEFADVLLEPPTTGNMNWLYRNTAYSASECYFTQTVQNNQQIDLITATSDDSTYQVRMTFPDLVKKGERPLDTANINITVRDIRNNEFFEVVDGTIKINSASRLLQEVRGRFIFTANSLSTSKVLLFDSGEFRAVSP